MPVAKKEVKLQDKTKPLRLISGRFFVYDELFFKINIEMTKVLHIDNSIIFIFCKNI